jgi:CarD family transcriptional regulator
MKAAGTAALDREQGGRAKTASGKPAVQTQAKAVPAAMKKEVKPTTARAAATAVASKSAPVARKPAATAATVAKPEPVARTAKPAAIQAAVKPAATPAKPSAAKPPTTAAGSPEGPAAAVSPPAARPESAAPAAEPAAPPAVPTAEAAKPAPVEKPDAPAPTEASAAPAAAPPRPATDATRRPGMPGNPPGPIVVPRPMAKAEVFQEGDHVVYPTHGVGKVERIATEEIAGHKLELIHITFEENRMTLRVPVAKARTAGLRKLATRKLFDEALAVLKGRARIKRTMWSRRAQEYEAKINSGDPLAIAEVVRDLHRNAGQPDQSFSERQIYEAAMDRLAAELAALDKTDKATAATKLTDFLKTV